MTDVKQATDIATDPLLYIAAALLIQSAKGLINTIRGRGSKNEHDASRNDELLTTIVKLLEEQGTVSKETVTMLAEIIAQNEDADECEASIKRELERVHDLVSDINFYLRDSASPSSNVALLRKNEKVIELLNEIQLELARNGK